MPFVDSEEKMPAWDLDYENRIADLRTHIRVLRNALMESTVTLVNIATVGPEALGTLEELQPAVDRWQAVLDVTKDQD